MLRRVYSAYMEFYLSLRVAGIARLSSATFHAKKLLKLHVRENDIVTL